MLIKLLQFQRNNDKHVIMCYLPPKRGKQKSKWQLEGLITHKKYVKVNAREKKGTNSPITYFSHNEEIDNEQKK